MSELRSFSKALLGANFLYTPRSEPVAGDLRMSWGLAILIIALHYSRSQKSNFQKLQFLAHAVRVDEGRHEVLGLLAGDYLPSEVSVRVEPALNRAVNFAQAIGLVDVKKGVSVSLTKKGIQLGEELGKLEHALDEERDFLKFVAPKLTDKLMIRIWRGEDL